MKQDPFLNTRFFFATAPMPCPYLPDKAERRVVTELMGPDASDIHDHLTLAGFRRSHGIAYAPACPDCNACIAVRIKARAFRPNRTQRRIAARNDDLVFAEVGRATTEQFELFTVYQTTRHAGGDMTRMDFQDYRRLVEDTPVDTALVEFRTPADQLVGACLVDRLGDGLSAVYSFFDADLQNRSLGTYMVMWLVARSAALELDNTYLGYLVNGCAKMAYKARFQPLEGYTPTGWRPLLADGSWAPDPAGAASEV